jgi:hypothetical protein
MEFKIKRGSFNLSIRAKPVTPPIRKLKQLELENSDLGETNLVVNRMKKSTPQRVKISRIIGVDFSMQFEVNPLKMKNKNFNIENTTSTPCGIRF